jgi:manganese oxidase
MVSRRDVLWTTAAVAGGTALLTRRASASQIDGSGAAWERSYGGGRQDAPASLPGQPGKDYKPVVTPSGASLPWKVVDDVKV